MDVTIELGLIILTAKSYFVVLLYVRTVQCYTYCSYCPPSLTHCNHTDEHQSWQYHWQDSGDLPVCVSNKSYATFLCTHTQGPSLGLQVPATSGPSQNQTAVSIERGKPQYTAALRVTLCAIIAAETVYTVYRIAGYFRESNTSRLAVLVNFAEFFFVGLPQCRRLWLWLYNAHLFSRIIFCKNSGNFSPSKITKNE